MSQPILYFEGHILYFQVCLLSYNMVHLYGPQTAL